MPAATDLLVDAFGRVREVVHEVLDSLPAEHLAKPPAPGANTIAWLVWHLTRIQDDHVAGVTGSEQVWTTGGWAARFGLPFGDDATGYGQSSEEVTAVRPESTELLTAYYDAVHARTEQFLRGLTDADFERIVDERWDPPVTLGVRLVSIIADDLQHAGQAAYIRGLLAG
jgi:uncharacterized damage-inducible protein DinB